VESGSNLHVDVVADPGIEPFWFAGPGIQQFRASSIDVPAPILSGAVAVLATTLGLASPIQNSIDPNRIDRTARIDCAMALASGCGRRGHASMGRGYWIEHDDSVSVIGSDLRASAEFLPRFVGTG
jgi:hypothetical protein